MPFIPDHAKFAGTHYEENLCCLTLNYTVLITYLDFLNFFQSQTKLHWFRLSSYKVADNIPNKLLFLLLIFYLQLQNNFLETVELFLLFHYPFHSSRHL